MAVIDTRLVQTAVIGSRDSEQPVILPEEPHNLDEFRRQFGSDHFWCGTLLGGCGEKLMTKRYEGKVCHFAHFPDRNGTRTACIRTANGVDSADHLFIKRDVKQWLASQGHAAQAELRSLGHGPGDAVDFWLRATEHHLRFELHPQDYRNWRRAADSLGAKAGHVEWVFGADVPLVHDMVARQGHALRVRCETSGNERRILIGVVTDKRPVEWADLDDCRMTTDGLITPVLEQLRTDGVIRPGRFRNDPLPASLPLRGMEIVFTVDASVPPMADSPFTHTDRYLVTAYVKASGSRILRATISLPNEFPTPSEEYVYRLSGVARLLLTDPMGADDAHWAVRADGLTRLNALEAERTGLWRPTVSLSERLKISPAAPPVQSNPQSPHTAQLNPTERSELATRIRQALLRVAAARTTTTWEELSPKLGIDLAHLPDPKRRDLLVEVDSPFRPDNVLLSLLVRTKSGRNLPYLDKVLRILDARLPVANPAFGRWCRREVERAYEKYGSAERPKTKPAASKSRATVATPRSYDGAASLARVQGLRKAVREAKELLPRASGRSASRLKKALTQGEEELRAHEVARGHGTAITWLTSHGRLLDNFTRHIRYACQDVERSLDRKSQPKSPKQTRTSRPSDRAPATPSAAGPETVSALKDITSLAVRFAAAKDADNLTEATKLWQEAGKIYGRSLPKDVQDKQRHLLVEMSDWVHSRESERVLAEIRPLLEQLIRAGDAVDTLHLRSSLAHLKILRRRHRGALPEDLREMFDACRRRLERKTSTSRFP